MYHYNLIAGNINFQQSGFILAITPFKLGANFGLKIDFQPNFKMQYLKVEWGFFL